MLAALWAVKALLARESSLTALLGASTAPEKELDVIVRSGLESPQAGLTGLQHGSRAIATIWLARNC